MEEEMKFLFTKKKSKAEVTNSKLVTSNFCNL